MRWMLVFAAMLTLPGTGGTAEVRSTSSVMYPRLIVFHGGELTRRHHLTFAPPFFDELREVPKGHVPDTSAIVSRINVVLYWYNPVWERYVRDTTLIATMPLPSDGTVQGRPQTREDTQKGWAEQGELLIRPQGKAPVLRCDDCLVVDGLRYLSPKAVEILQERGVLKR